MDEEPIFYGRRSGEITVRADRFILPLPCPEGTAGFTPHFERRSKSRGKVLRRNDVKWRRTDGKLRRQRVPSERPIERKGGFSRSNVRHTLGTVRPKLIH